MERIPHAITTYSTQQTYSELVLQGEVDTVDPLNALPAEQEPTGTLRHLCVRASRLWYRLCSYSDLG